MNKFNVYTSYFLISFYAMATGLMIVQEMYLYAGLAVLLSLFYMWILSIHKTKSNVETENRKTLELICLIYLSNKNLKLEEVFNVLFLMLYILKYNPSINWKYTLTGVKSLDLNDIKIQAILKTMDKISLDLLKSKIRHWNQKEVADIIDYSSTLKVDNLTELAHQKIKDLNIPLNKEFRVRNEK